MNLVRGLTLLLLFVLLSRFGMADPVGISAEDRRFFETKIRPVLVEHCFECHSTDAADIGGGLLLDSAAALRKGGLSGPVVQPGKPQASLLIQALRYEESEMPPDDPLPENIIHDFVTWVQRGAPDPRAADEAPKPNSSDAAQQTRPALWSLQPVSSDPPPEVQDETWGWNELDRFVLAPLEADKLRPGADASPEHLVRRLFIDLTGLPPEHAQIQAFVADYQQDPQQAITRQTDELLASPHFGERWGRHWLDVARYGESNGNDGLGRNPTFPHAWRYRDYVIDAFNRDLPYDRFITEQIAGDLLPADSDEQRDRQIIATGFLAITAKPAKAMNTNFDMDVVADQIDVVGTGIMGISVACARCHDHKFDPIPTRDYYALAGIFTSTETMWGVAANEGLTAPKTDLHVLQAAAVVKPPEDFVETVLVLDSNTGVPRPIPKPPWPVGTPLAMGVRDKKEPADCPINVNGNSQKKGDTVPRGFLSACDLPGLGELKIDAGHSGRQQLAQWLTHADHPLTARVFVNRVWQHLFGQGLVKTADDFGVYGAAPTHPRLLDHLASGFVQDQWSIKRLIRRIVTSRTWQLSSLVDEDQQAVDPTAERLTYHLRRRLDAETLRDSMLKVSGQLDPEPGDGSLIRHRDILVNLAGNLHQPSSKRSVYLCYLRSSPPPELAAFNLPEFTQVTGRRDSSTVTGHSLHLSNNPFVVEQATAFAEYLLQRPGSSEDRIQTLWQRALGRNSDPEEAAAALQLLQASLQQTESKTTAWTCLCQALLMTSEFRYID